MRVFVFSNLNDRLILLYGQCLGRWLTVQRSDDFRLAFFTVINAKHAPSVLCNPFAHSFPCMVEAHVPADLSTHPRMRADPMRRRADLVLPGLQRRQTWTEGRVVAALTAGYFSIVENNYSTKL